MSDVAQRSTSAISVHVHQEDVVVAGSDVDRYCSPVSLRNWKRWGVKVCLDVSRVQSKHAISLCSGYPVRSNDHRCDRVPCEGYWVLNAGGRVGLKVEILSPP